MTSIHYGGAVGAGASAFSDAGAPVDDAAPVDGAAGAFGLAFFLVKLSSFALIMFLLLYSLCC